MEGDSEMLSLSFSLGGGTVKEKYVYEYQIGNDKYILYFASKMYLERFPGKLEKAIIYYRGLKCYQFLPYDVVKEIALVKTYSKWEKHYNFILKNGVVINVKNTLANWGTQRV